MCNLLVHMTVVLCDKVAMKEAAPDVAKLAPLTAVIVRCDHQCGCLV